ncbi:MAG: hypothetical protein RRY29_11325 [Desulfovibrionaceae bacterium]
MEISTIKSTFGELRAGKVATATTAAAIAVDPTTEAEKQDAFSMKGDTVDITEQGKKLATQGMTAPNSVQKNEKEEPEAENPLVKSAKDRIKQLQEEIKAVEQSNLPEQEKQRQILMLQQEITLQTKVLEEAQKAAAGVNKRYGKGGLKF